MGQNVTQKLIESHLIDGEMSPGKEIGLKVDQTLTQDATGTLVMLELEALGLDEVKSELSVQYVDHNILQTDHKNPDDHRFLQSACQKFGLWYSRPGNGVSHPVHMERFGVPGKTMVGSDSHTPAAGALGMLAIGAGGLDVALAMAGYPLYLKMPKVLGVKLNGKLPDWTSAKDVVLTMLENYDVDGAVGKIIEYYGPGLKSLDAMDRHVIANMGTEMGATSTVFPSDEATKRFLTSQQRPNTWTELIADEDATYDEDFEIDLGTIVPKIALPSSPGKVNDVEEVAGKPVNQVVVGSSANPGLRDFWMVAQMVENKHVHPDVSLDINPTSRQVIENLGKMGAFNKLIHAGVRFHQTGCLGCIGMGQAPASDQISLRTMPRNFPGRSGTANDQVYLCSPETATASALTGKITDPRDMKKRFNCDFPNYEPPELEQINDMLLVPPPHNKQNQELIRGPNIKPLPEFESLPDKLELPVGLKVGDNISTDEILPAGTKVLPYRSNIPKISEFAFSGLDENYYDRSIQLKKSYSGHVLVGGKNYAQGSSREHAAIAVRYLGQRITLAKSYARIGWQNLVNFGVLPLEFQHPDDYDDISLEDVLKTDNLHEALNSEDSIKIKNLNTGNKYDTSHAMSKRQVKIMLAGSIIDFARGNL